MNVLGIETSCDETSVACVGEDGVRANLISSQVDLHERFGGVVPELASRAHLTNLLPVVHAALDEAGWTLDDVQAVAATAGPGLIEGPPDPVGGVPIRMPVKSANLAAEERKASKGTRTGRASS